jgi:type IV pilus assembly protein PilF
MNFKVRNTYAVFLCGQKRFDDAGKQFDRAIRAPDNDNAEITLTNAGVCMTQRPDYGKAEAFFRQALERRANHPEALLQLSVLKHQTGDYLNARAFLQRYLSVTDATPSVLFLGLQIEEELGDDRARASYANQLLRDFPNSAEARRVLESN